MGNSPAFQYYPADLISDPEVMFWDMESLGAYWQMITYLWLNEGHFEFTLENLRKLFRKKTQKTAERLWENIKKKFIWQDGVVSHKRINEEMQKQAAYRLAKVEAGQKGAEARWYPDGRTKNLPMANGMANDGSSVCCLQSSIQQQGNSTPVERAEAHLKHWLELSKYKAQMAAKMPYIRGDIQADCEIYADCVISAAIDEVGPNCYSWMKIRECLIKQAAARAAVDQGQADVDATSEMLRKNRERAQNG